jgi:hypothetical protein
MIQIHPIIQQYPASANDSSCQFRWARRGLHPVLHGCWTLRLRGWQRFPGWRNHRNLSDFAELNGGIIWVANVNQPGFLFVRGWHEWIILPESIDSKNIQKALNGICIQPICALCALGKSWISSANIGGLSYHHVHRGLNIITMNYLRMMVALTITH